MAQHLLSTELAAFAAWLKRHDGGDLIITAPALSMLVREFDTFAGRASELEDRERQLTQMEAVAADLDVVIHEQRKAVPGAAMAGTNILFFPTCRPMNGGAA